MLKTIQKNLKHSDEGNNKQAEFAAKLLQAFETAPTLDKIRSIFRCAVIVFHNEKIDVL